METDLFKLCRRVRENDPTLTILNLFQRNLDNDGVVLVTEAMKFNTNVVVLILTGNFISDKGAKLISKSLPSSVNYLYLGKNYIGESGALALSKLKQLKILDLSYNSVGCEGAAHIAKLLREPSSSLLCLILRDNGIGERGLRELARALHVNNSLQTLHLSRNQVCTAALGEFRDAFRVNRTLRRITLDCVSDNQTDAQEILDLYHLGRAFLCDTTAIPTTWPTIFQKLAREPELLHEIVRGRPELFVKS